MTQEPDTGIRPVHDQPPPRDGERNAAAVRAAETDRPGDAACWLRRVCPTCGTLADEDPPTTCAHCHSAITLD
jgi:hypothetical protein